MVNMLCSAVDAMMAAAAGIPNLVQAMHLSDDTPQDGGQQGDEEDEEQKGEAGSKKGSEVKGDLSDRGRLAGRLS